MIVVDEEHEVILALSVEIFLVSHLLIVVALNEEGIIVERNAEYGLAVEIVTHTKARMLGCEQTVDGHLRHHGRHFRVVAYDAVILRPRTVADRVVRQRGVVVSEECVVVVDEEGEVGLIEAFS